MNDSGLGITKESLLLIVPPALTQDPAMMARAAADAEALAARLGEIDRVRVISNIDGLDETYWIFWRGILRWIGGTRSVDRASVRVPPLKRPGATAGLTAGGAFAGYRQRVDGAVDVPSLARPKGAAGRAVSTGCFGSIQRASVSVKVGAAGVKVPAGRAATAGAAGVFHSYQRIRVSVGNPAITISGR